MKKFNLITQLMVLFVLSSVIGFLSIGIGSISSYTLQQSADDIKIVEEKINHNLEILHIHEEFLGDLSRHINSNTKPKMLATYNNCILGKWYYDFKESEEFRKLPENLKSKFLILEEAHKKIHQIAFDYKDKYIIYDKNIQTIILKREAEHLEWAQELGNEILENRKISVEGDFRLCNYGKWYYNLKNSAEFERMDINIKNKLLDIETPHKTLHEAIGEISKLQEEKKYDDMKKYYINNILVNLKKVQKDFRDIVEYVDTIKEENEKVKNEVIVQAPKNLKIVEDTLEEYNKYLTIKKDKIIDNNNQIVNIVIVSFIVIFIISLTSTFYGVVVNGSAIKKSMEITDSIIENSKSINQSAIEVSKSAVNLSQMAGKQASIVEDVTVSTDNAVSVLNENDQSIDRAKILSNDMQETTTNGYDSIKDLMSAMDNVNSSATKISQILKNIDEIAFQTNLLSLNAAVEAARAGEHGLGFAVVAEEVRALASKSAAAAKETSAIINKSIDDIKIGNRISIEANNSYKDILEKINETHKLIEHISYSSKEQSNIVLQLSHSIHEISSVTQHLASSSEELAVSSEEMSTQSEDINEQIKQLSKNR